MKSHSRSYDDLEQLLAARHCYLREAGYSPTDALALAAVNYKGVEDGVRPDSSKVLPETTAAEH